MHSRSAYIPRQWCELACQACYKVCILCATRYDRVSEHYTHLQHLMCAFSGAVPGTTVAGTFHASCQLPTLFSRRQACEHSWRSLQFSSAIAANSMTLISGVMHDCMALSSSSPIIASHEHIPRFTPTSPTHDRVCQRGLCSLHQSMLSDRRCQEP